MEDYNAYLAWVAQNTDGSVLNSSDAQKRRANCDTISRADGNQRSANRIVSFQTATGSCPRGHSVTSRLFLSVWLGSVALAQPLVPARVSSVTDGDTVKLIIGTDFVRVRLDSIDAPEKRQPGGKESRQALQNLMPDGSAVQLLSKGQDRYGRTIGQIYLPDGSNVNSLQVRNGQAWVFRRYCKDPKYWLPLEYEAQVKHRGLWARPGAVAPWEYRHSKRNPGSVHGSAT